MHNTNTLEIRYIFLSQKIKINWSGCEILLSHTNPQLTEGTYKNNNEQVYSNRDLLN